MSGENTKDRPYPAPPAVARLRRLAFLVGVVGLGLSGVGFLVDRQQFLQSYLVAWLFWLSLALGALAVALLHHLSHGAWGIVIRRALLAAGRTLPLLALLFVPLALDLGALYPWARPEVMAGDELLQHKAWYLEEGFFLSRAAIYFAAWIFLAWLLGRMSLAQERRPDARRVRRMQLVAAPGLALYCLTTTFASFDWLMSLDPHWYSTLYGVYLIGSHGLAGIAFMALAGVWLAGREPMAGVLAPRHFHDWGNLLLAFVSLWAYFAVSQLIIVWSGNLPEEITWYLHRRHGGWQVVSVLVVLAQFVLPFVLLLSRDLKRHPAWLGRVALLVLAAHWLDYYWQAGPVFHEEVSLHWLDATTLAGIGGVWLGTFCQLLRGRSLLPLNDPYLEEALGDD